jgi:hypothetical protein
MTKSDMAHTPKVTDEIHPRVRDYICYNTRKEFGYTLSQTKRVYSLAGKSASDVSHSPGHIFTGK